MLITKAGLQRLRCSPADARCTCRQIRFAGSEIRQIRNQDALNKLGGGLAEAVGQWHLYAIQCDVRRGLYAKMPEGVYDMICQGRHAWTRSCSSQHLPRCKMMKCNHRYIKLPPYRSSLCPLPFQPTHLLFESVRFLLAYNLPSVTLPPNLPNATLEYLEQTLRSLSSKKRASQGAGGDRCWFRESMNDAYS